MAALRVLPPHDYVGRHRGHRRGRSSWSRRCWPPGAAYVVDDAEYPDVYFRADATAQFGYESGYDRDTMLRAVRRARRRPGPRRARRDPLDALLWRAERPGEPSWPSPFGAGPARLARRVRGDRARAASAPASTSRAAAAT